MISITKKLSAMRRALSTARPEALTKKGIKHHVRSTIEEKGVTKSEAEGHTGCDELPAGETSGDVTTHFDNATHHEKDAD
jgi:hypothetical protein